MPEAISRCSQPVVISVHEIQGLEIEGASGSCTEATTCWSAPSAHHSGLHGMDGENPTRFLVHIRVSLPCDQFYQPVLLRMGVNENLNRQCIARVHFMRDIRTLRV